MKLETGQVEVMVLVGDCLLSPFFLLFVIWFSFDLVVLSFVFCFSKLCFGMICDF